MSVNPIQFGKDVIDQFGRYLLTTFRLSDPHLAAQLKAGLAYEPGTHERLAKGPYVFLNRPFVQGPGIRQLIAEEGLDLHPALRGLFPFETLHKHQEKSLRMAVEGRHVLMATGTGSGKTEGFLLPILDYCLKLRDSGAPPGVAAVLIYPMNALVNDQLERLRRLLAGSRITFGRYTGETPNQAEGMRRLESARKYSQAEIRRADERLENLPLPWEECPSRDDIRSRRPRLILTNYSMLEYLLLRDRDLQLFRDAPLRFFVLDEVHTYTGALGSEVACLLRRLRTVAGKAADEVISIGSSATVTDRKGSAVADPALRGFAARLFGVRPERVELVKEEYQRLRPAEGERYLPPVPEGPKELLDEILGAVREPLLSDEVSGVPPEVLALAERLCGRPASEEGNSLERLFDLLAPNRLVELLQECFTRPATLEEVLPRVQPLGDRRDLAAGDLQAEILAYLTLGALARRDDEPLMRPKLHYFIQGLHGLWLRWEGSEPSPRPGLQFIDKSDEDYASFRLSLCRSCGQHFIRAHAFEREAVDAAHGTDGLRRLAGTASGSRVGEDAKRESLYFTDRLVTEEAEEPGGERAFLCRYCGALHDAASDECREAKCRRSVHLVEVLTFPHPVARCPACDARSTERSPVITPVRSTEVYDVMILAQTELASMPEADLRKVLIFADSRQDAAFQAGWMESRSLRFRVRHLAYQILAEDPERSWYFENLARELAERATAQGMVPARGRGREHAIDRLRWLLIEEFFAATERQRRNSLEQLGLARLTYEGVSPQLMSGFAERWAPELDIDAAGLADLIGLVLDVLRLRHAVSHRFLGRWWSDRDWEVREGIVSAPEYFRPQLVLRRTPDDRRQKAFAVGFLSKTRATAVERFVAKALPGVRRERLDEFLSELWDGLVQQKLLVPRRLKVKRYGKLVDLAGIEAGYQVNLDLIQIAHASERFVCDQCGTARPRMAPGGACPAYNCRGSLHLEPRDEEHYDVVQYTRFQFVPLLSREHSAQVPREDRLFAESEFKKTEGRVNCLVATPTLEMGVDIGPLELVLMRNVPPSPANYAQRSGRAGRRHRIGAIFSYCRNTQHDQYFYRDPPSMIAGEVRIPAFSMRNEPLIRKHVFSAVLAALRSEPEAREVLARSFPTFIWSYFGKRDPEEPERRHLRLEKPDFSELGALIARHRPRLLENLKKTFTDQWPEADWEVVTEELLGETAGAMAGDLETAVGTLIAEIKAYQTILGELRRLQQSGELLTREDERRRNNYERALHALWREEQDNYSLAYLSRRGFFPGYALVRDSVRAQCLEPPLDLHRNLPIAIRELTPASRIYANRQEFKVRRMDFYRLKAGQPEFEPDQLEQEMVLDRENERVLASARGQEGGESPGVAFSSLQLIDVELDGLGRISDQQEYRSRVPYEQYSLLLPEHRGGHGGTVGLVPFQLLRDARLRLVNLGPRYPSQASPGIGFPICIVCGETRSPFASATEIENFGAHHLKRCGREVRWHALHADVATDLLLLGPFEEDRNAVNALESMRIGARRVLEMGDQELEVELLKDDEGRSIGVLYDPLPGGSGLLPLVMEYWEPIVDAAKEVLVRCDCDGACYRCLLHYRNQQHHQVLDRNQALSALAECQGEFRREHEIAARFVDRKTDPKKADSTKEEQLLKVLGARGFPLPPEAQCAVELGGGSRTVADFAYPESRVLIYVDGLSQRIHGNEEQRRTDRRLRTKAKLAGWHICAISAEGLSDQTMLADYLDELAMLLGLE